MSENLDHFKAIGKQALEDLKKIDSFEELDRFRIKYLSRKGEITGLLSQLGKLPKELRPQAGQLANKIKNEVKDAFEQWQAKFQLSAKTTEGPLLVPGRGMPTKIDYAVPAAGRPLP